jgi:hypothetical protein
VGGETRGSFATLTHARIRAAQGDLEGAERILRVILQVQPAHDEARALLVDLGRRAALAHHEPASPAPEPATAATAEALAPRFRGELSSPAGDSRAVRLRAWIEGALARRGARRD